MIAVALFLISKKVSLYFQLQKRFLLLALALITGSILGLANFLFTPEQSKQTPSNHYLTIVDEVAYLNDSVYTGQMILVTFLNTSVLLMTSSEMASQTFWKDRYR